MFEYAGSELGNLLSNAEGDATRFAVSIQTATSVAGLFRAFWTTTDGYLTFSPRPGLIWDRQLVARIGREIQAVETLGWPWFCLSADGADLAGRTYAAAFFNNEPTLVPDRGRRPIVESAGTIFVVRMASFHALGLRRFTGTDLTAVLNDLILIAYGRGFGSYFTSGLYPCLEERRSLDYTPIDDLLVRLNPLTFLPPSDADELFPDGVARREILSAWSDVVDAACSVKRRLSFVVRTLFRRNDLLRRCLISIEYLRSSLDLTVEVVIASDADSTLVADGVRQLSIEFPALKFVTADGRAEAGHSRVRNLIAGICATTGSRVCIIDDDDYYTPQAVVIFAQACAFDLEQMVIFDTQVIVEKWIHTGVKAHREVLAYKDLFAAKNWAVTLEGSNSIPLCGIIHPGWFVRRVAKEYTFDYDCSEDFIFHLYCFAHPMRPPLKIVDGIGAYQSHRDAGDNVMTVGDRRRWVLDTGNGLYGLLFEQGWNFDGVSASGSAGGADLRKRVAELEAELASANDALEKSVEALAKVTRVLVHSKG